MFLELNTNLYFGSIPANLKDLNVLNFSNYFHLITVWTTIM